MFNSSPIETWDGAGVFYSFAGTGGTDLFFWLSVICCIIPLFVSLTAENAAEGDHR